MWVKGLHYGISVERHEHKYEDKNLLSVSHSYSQSKTGKEQNALLSRKNTFPSNGSYRQKQNIIVVTEQKN